MNGAQDDGVDISLPNYSLLDITFYAGSGSKVVVDGVPRQRGAPDLYRWTGRAPTPFEKVT